jgi:hypothetical protein
VVFCSASRGDRFVLVATTGHGHGQARRERGELHRLLGRTRIGEHRKGGGDAFVDLVLVHRHRGGRGVDDELEDRVGGALVDQREHRMCLLHVAHRPEQRRHPGDTPLDELEFVEVAWFELGQDRVGGRGLALPQQRA